MNKFRLFIASLISVSFFSVTAVATEACLITKTDINPFFVKMKEGAEARANELGIKLSFFAGKVDGDHETQVRAVETCIASGAKGILIAASDTKAIVPVLKNAQDNIDGISRRSKTRLRWYDEDFEKKNSPLCGCEHTRTRITLSKVLHYARVLCLLFPSWNWLLDGRRPVVPIEVFVLHGL
mgnify:CR=1 FL=1